MAIASPPTQEVALVERLCRSLGIDPQGVDELTVHFRVGERPVIRVRRLADAAEGARIFAELERYDIQTLRRR